MTIIDIEWNGRQRHFICKCKCGNITKPIFYHSLKSGRVKSCGCYLLEKLKERNGNERQLYYLINNEYIRFRSSFEIMYAMILDKQSIDWEYEPQMFDLSNGWKYTPDFYLSDTNEFIEVKGYLNETAKIKCNLFQIEYQKYNYKLVFGKELEDSLGIKCDKFLKYWDEYIEEPL